MATESLDDIRPVYALETLQKKRLCLLSFVKFSFGSDGLFAVCVPPGVASRSCRATAGGGYGNPGRFQKRRDYPAVNVLQVRLVNVYVDGSQFGPEQVPVSRFVPEPGYWRGTPYVSRMGHADGDGKVIGGEGIHPNLPPHSTSQVRWSEG